jgi:dihydrodipicolinate synthase/N-acetylneuraminate lyase
MTINSVTTKIQPGREIIGMSAVLLPFDESGQVDLDSLAPNIKRTVDAGLTPAVNMDTGYTNLITAEERTRVLRLTQEVVQGKQFVAGAFIQGAEGSETADGAKSLYKKAVAEIQEFGGTPILFQCMALKNLERKELVSLYREVASECKEVLGFELGEMFAPFGTIYDLDTMRDLMEIPQLTGAKHSSLNRELEWQRLELRDAQRPDFKIYTGNDLAIDMVCYGSDYLLGLSAFCPEAFALRDRLWKENDSRFYGLNDLLQYLGFFAFRPPVPAYKHTCAQLLKLRGRIASSTPHPKAASRPESDIEILADISSRLDEMMNGLSDPLPELASDEALI